MVDRYSENNNKPVSSRETADEIDLIDIFRQLWLKRWFILRVTGIFLLLGLFIAIFSPVKYTAHCTVVPQSKKDGSANNLGGFAAMMGVNIGTGGAIGETLSPSIYPQIIKSVPFTREIMQTPIKVERSQGEEITLYDFYTNAEYKPFNLIGSIKKYTIGLPGLLIEAIRGGDKFEEKIVFSDTLSLSVLSKREEQVYRIIQSSILLNMNQKDGYITISYTLPEAESAARVTDQVRIMLEKYVTTFKLEKVEENLLFVEQSFQEAKNDFLEKQERLALFQDANRGLTTASARTTEQRLRSEYDIAFTVYNELAKQLEQAKLAVKESKPILTIIDPVVVPIRKSAPRRSVILATFIFLGTVVGIGWVLTKPFYQKVVQSIKDNKKE